MYLLQPMYRCQGNQWGAPQSHTYSSVEAAVRSAKRQIATANRLGSPEDAYQVLRTTNARFEPRDTEVVLTVWSDGSTLDL